MGIKPGHIRLIAGLFLCITVLTPIWALACLYCAGAIAFEFVRDFLFLE